MITEEIRSYEVSLWTLQDEFITVLKWSNIEQQGGIFDTKMTLNIDGTEKLSFSIPMYLYTFIEGDRTITINRSNSYMQRIENPIWYNTRNGNLIANMRKIKVIFNKGDQELEKVFEFIITRVTEKHEGEQLNCEIECEGLAFHELGKIGYKISLSSDVFQDKVIEWFSSDQSTPEPIANLQYWNENNDNNCLNLPMYDSENLQLQWYYDIQMKWDDVSLDSKKVYEDTYNSWEYETDLNGENGRMVPKDTYIGQEKARLIDLEGSNLYNLTQDIAEKFGVFCRYEYIHDENYHIVAKVVIYYNNFIDENQIIHLTYPYSSSSISREMDGTDLITKMYVNSIDSDITASGLITIMNSEANKSKEDYIFNFDYLYTIGAITEEQYNEVEQYENEIGILNSLAIPMENKRDKYKAELDELRASLTIAQRSRDAATEQLTNLDQQLQAIDAKDGRQDGIITASAQTGTIIKGQDKYYLEIKEKGVDFTTLEIYRNYDYGGSIGKDLIPLGKPQYDDYNNLIRVEWATLNDPPTLVYLNYDYSPSLYYDHIRSIWEIRLYNDKNNIIKYEQQINNIENQLSSIEQDLDTNYNSKKEKIASFNRLMGPALREGNWTPDDYKNCENSYIDTIITNSAQLSTNTRFIWDNNLLTEEQNYQYQADISGIMEPYLCIKIDNTILNSQYFDDLSIIYWDINSQILNTYTDDQKSKYAKSLHINASCQYAIVEDAYNNKQPVIMLTSITNLSETELNLLKSNCIIGVLNVSVNNGELTTTITTIKEHSYISNNWIIPTAMAYPRIRFNSDSLIINDEKLIIKINNQVLENYNDYYVLLNDGQYCITFKHSSYLKYAQNINTTIQVYYTISNASTSIYLDAVEILKENAYPKVAYIIESNVLDTNFIKSNYNSLGKLVYINDTDLKLENVFGYISGLDLDLINPQNDSIEVKNYKTKFEDLFSSIVASSESMQKNSYTLDSLSAAFNSDGSVKKDTLQKSILKVDLDYAFNNGKLTIDNENGIWCTSDTGVVAISGGGIFTASSKDYSGNWIWNTGITPEGINANLITTGQLDTSKIMIYAGDQIRLQINDQGLFAYKSIFDDKKLMAALREESAAAANNPNASTPLQNFIEQHAQYKDLDMHQYVVHNENGLFLIAEEGAIIYDETAENDKIKLLGQNEGIVRVEISWDGLVLRNWSGRETLKADPDTGDLTITGNIVATTFITHDINGNKFKATADEFGIYGPVRDDHGDIITDEVGIVTFGNNTMQISSDYQIIANGGLQITASHLYLVADSSVEVPNNSLANKFNTIDNDINGVSGTVSSITNGTTPVKYVSTTGIEISGNSLQVKSTGTLEVVSNGTLRLASGGTIDINSTNFKVNSQPTGTNPIFFAGNSNGEHIQYSSAGLEIVGNGTFTGTINATALSVGNSNSSLMTYSAANGLQIGSGDNSLSYDGNTLSIKGNIAAESGTFTGVITATKLNVGPDANTQLMSYDSANNNGLVIGNTSSGNPHLQYSVNNSTNKLAIEGDITATSFTAQGASNGNKFVATSNQFGIYTSSGNPIITFDSNNMIIGNNYTIKAQGGLLVTADNIKFTTTTNDTLANKITDMESNTSSAQSAANTANTNIGKIESGDKSAGAVSTTGISITKQGALQITSTATIDINSTNFIVNSQATGTSSLFQVGSASGNSYIKYSGNGTLTVKGDITATSGSFTGDVTASSLIASDGTNTQLQIVPGGISGGGTSVLQLGTDACHFWSTGISSGTLSAGHLVLTSSEFAAAVDSTNYIDITGNYARLQSSQVSALTCGETHQVQVTGSGISFVVGSTILSLTAEKLAKLITLLEG